MAIAAQGDFRRVNGIRPTPRDAEVREALSMRERDSSSRERDPLFDSLSSGQTIHGKPTIY